MTVRIHPIADVSDNAQIGTGSSLWRHAQMREGERIGSNSIVGKGIYARIDQE